MLRQPIESGQYTSFRLAEHLDVAGIAASIGSVGDACDNALVESAIGLYKTELIKPQRPWKTLFQQGTVHGGFLVELADTAIRRAYSTLMGTGESFTAQCAEISLRHRIAEPQNAHA
ncbi:hypothetical protein ACWD4K_35940, partial [Streptomyces gelaticus]